MKFDEICFKSAKDMTTIVVFKGHKVKVLVCLKKAIFIEIDKVSVYVHVDVHIHVLIIQRRGQVHNA